MPRFLPENPELFPENFPGIFDPEIKKKSRSLPRSLEAPNYFYFDFQAANVVDDDISCCRSISDNDVVVVDHDDVIVVDHDDVVVVDRDDVELFSDDYEFTSKFAQRVVAKSPTSRRQNVARKTTTTETTFEEPTFQDPAAVHLHQDQGREWPQGHSAMDKALACHAGGWGSNPDTTTDL